MPNKYLDSVGLAEYTSLVKADLATKAPLASPALTGTPTAPTPTAGDDSTKIATTEFVQDAIDEEETRADEAYLPFTGGSITGNLSVSGTITGDVTGDLTGNADTATNATNDGNGNQIDTTYLPLSGGTINGELTLNTSSGTRLLHLYQNGSPFATLGVTGPENGQGISLLSKEGSFGDSFLSLSPSNKSSDPSFALVAGNGTTTKYLVGRPDGTLTWDGNNVITSAGGTINGDIKLSNRQILNTEDNGLIRIQGGTAESKGSRLVLNGMSRSVNPGAFELVAHNGTTSKSLVGKPDGTLTWDGESVPGRSYGISLVSTAGQNTYTFTIAGNGAVIFAKRGSNASIHMVDYWSAGSVRLGLGGTDPITITKSGNSSSVTITNTSSSAVAIKILNGGAL